MGFDDANEGAQAGECPGHVWGLNGLHLSMQRGVEQDETCARCGAVRYVVDELRKSRPPLS